jgi:hypothetical protein
LSKTGRSRNGRVSLAEQPCQIKNPTLLSRIIWRTVPLLSGIAGMVTGIVVVPTSIQGHHSFATFGEFVVWFMTGMIFGSFAGVMVGMFAAHWIIRWIDRSKET